MRCEDGRGSKSGLRSRENLEKFRSAGRRWGISREDGVHFRVLGVPRWSSPQEIKSAYRKLALRCHPDRNPGDPTAEEEFKRAAEAYEVLSDPQERARYENSGDARVQVFQLNMNRFNIVLIEGRPSWSIRITDRSGHPYVSESSRKEYCTKESAIAGAFDALIYMEKLRRERLGRKD